MSSPEITCEQQESVNQLVKIDYKDQSFMASVTSLSHIGILLLANSCDVSDSLRTGHKVTLVCNLPSEKEQLNIESVVVRIGELAQGDGKRKKLLGLKYAADSKNKGETLRNLLPQFSPQVLVVHSEWQNLEIVRDSLEGHFQVWAAQTAEEALSIIAANEILVLIIDQAMPGLHGSDLLDDIDAYYPDSNAVRIVITSDENLSLLEDFIKAKRIFYLVKTPVLLPQILAIVQDAVEYYWSTILPGSKPELDQESASGSPPVKPTFEQPFNIFRPEALENYNRGYHSEGDILRISPAWIRWAYPLLILVALAGLLYSFFGRISEYSVGPAVVRIEGRVDLTAVAPGIVTSIEARPGQSVVANQLLIRFYNAQEAAQLESINRQYDLQMIETLRNPSDTAAQQALALLRARKQTTEAQLEERSVRAPQAGFVSDIRIRPGQHVSSGDPLLSLGSGDNKLATIAVLPGHFRPLLKSGMPLRLELSGYRNAYQELTIDSIGDEVIGPNEIRRYLGQEIADTITISGPLVLVHARLSSKTFNADGQTYAYHDGMPGTAEVRVRDERILFELFPGLKGLFKKSNE